MPKIVGNITGRGSTTPILFDVKAYGATGDGVTNDYTAITAAITAATAAGGGTVYFPAGTYSIATRIALKDKVSLKGAGRTVVTIKPTAAVATSVMLGSSGDTVSGMTISGLGIDANYPTANIKAVQITSGDRVEVRDVWVRNCGGAGIYFEASTDVKVVDSVIETTGQSDSSTGHGVLVQNGFRSIISNNQVLDIKGGMGIAAAIAAAGNPRVIISDNYVRMAVSATGFEGIGLTDGCNECTISGNVIDNSQDNGISCSGNHCTVIGNTINGAVNHGIHAGSHNTIVGNVIKNVGKEGINFGFISCSTGNVIVGNRCYDDQGSPTSYHAVKFQVSPPQAIVVGNRFTNYTNTKFKRVYDGLTTIPTDTFVCDYTAQQDITGSRGGNAALASLLTALANIGIIKDSTT